MFSMQCAPSQFANLCFPLQREARFPKFGSKSAKQIAKLKRSGCIEQYRDDENTKWHTIFTKLHIWCIQLCLQSGLGGENGTRLQPEATFKSGMEQKNGEPSEQSHDRSDSIQQNVPYRSRWRVEKVYLFIKIAWSRFSKLCLPLQREAYFCKNMKATWAWA